MLSIAVASSPSNQSLLQTLTCVPLTHSVALLAIACCPIALPIATLDFSRSETTIANVAASATVRASVQAGYGKPPGASPCEPVAVQRHRATGTCTAPVASLRPPLEGQCGQPPHAAGQMAQEPPLAHPRLIPQTLLKDEQLQTGQKLTRVSGEEDTAESRECPVY